MYKCMYVRIYTIHLTVPGRPHSEQINAACGWPRLFVSVMFAQAVCLNLETWPPLIPITKRLPRQRRGKSSVILILYTLHSMNNLILGCPRVVSENGLTIHFHLTGRKSFPPPWPGIGTAANDFYGLIQYVKWKISYTGKCNYRMNA